MDFQKFDAIVSPSGIVGMIVHIGHEYSRIMVQFGAAGPFRHYAPTSLRLATPSEVRHQRKEGVGGIVIRGKEE